MFEILIRYYSLTSILLSFLRMNLSITKFSSSRVYLIPSSLSQYVFNLSASLPIRRGPGVIMNVLMRKHDVLHNKIFCCCKIYYYNTIIQFHPKLVLKISSLPKLALKSSNKFSCRCHSLQSDRNPSLIYHKTSPSFQHLHPQLAHEHPE